MNDSIKSVRNYLISGIPFIFILGGLTHFAYELSGENRIVAIFAPVSESVWEHTKMSFWVYLIWWIVGYLILSHKHQISISRWFTSCAVALFVPPVFIVTFFYTYTGALGFHSLVADITSLLLALIVSQLVSLHIYMYVKVIKSHLVISVVAIIALIAVYVFLTFYPPHVPLFYDYNSGNYGLRLN